MIRSSATVPVIKTPGLSNRRFTVFVRDAFTPAVRNTQDRNILPSNPGRGAPLENRAPARPIQLASFARAYPHLKITYVFRNK
ncbi:hypothetical protein EVAR_89362_1 [Eumeta japonica]|uniref:Uncharacterized protein n=1 Tax=Eumeta variegata TaxID=151549 RepID=A0A4C1Y1V9_EUMVA|nr:hypothetical protein EVAR_89362_1 [Eumeta japonica]